MELESCLALRLFSISFLFCFFSIILLTLQITSNYLTFLIFIFILTFIYFTLFYFVFSFFFFTVLKEDLLRFFFHRYTICGCSCKDSQRLTYTGDQKHRLQTAQLSLRLFVLFMALWCQFHENHLTNFYLFLMKNCSDHIVLPRLWSNNMTWGIWKGTQPWHYILVHWDTNGTLWMICG